MLDALVIEKIALIVLGFFFLVNLITGLSKQPNTYMVPVITLILACAVVIAAIVMIAQQTHIPWVKVYYWRYSYLGSIPIVMPFTYAWASSLWQEWWSIIVFVVTLLLFWLFGWFIGGCLVWCGCFASGMHLLDCIPKKRFQMPM
ncbi:MAG: hypothetical protein V1719_00600 [Patescibacteria group bacterium]